MQEDAKQTQDSDNDGGENMSTDKLRQEDLQNCSQTLAEVDQGKQESTYLLDALSGDWSLEHFLEVAKRRGRSYRHLLALADKSQEIQG